MTETQAEYFSPQPKGKPYRNADYLKFIRSKPCEICCRKAVAAHVRKLYWQAGTSQKPHDYVAISLCEERQHHQILDSIGMEAFEEKYCTNIKRIIINNLMEYIESKRK